MVTTHRLNFATVDIPTIVAFMQNDAFIRGLMGPFGCLPSVAEFLTPTGWKCIADYRPGDQLAVWMPTGEAWFEAPEAYINEPCQEMLLFDSGSLKMAVTPEHRMPHWDYAGRFAVATAAQIAMRPSRRVIPTTFRITGTSMPMPDDLIRFAVMMHADGHYPEQGKRAVVEVHKDRKKVRVRELLSALGVDWSEHGREERPDATLFRFEPPYVGKHFEGDWWSCSEAQLRVVLDEIDHWDGLHNHAEKVFTTTYKGDADFIQYAAHATGRRAAIHQQVDPRGEGRWAPTYFVRIRTSDSAKNRARISEHTNISTTRPTDGRKYCFTTSTGFWIARYQDTVFVTGNSGKSSGCVWDIIQRGLRQKAGLDGIRRTRWAVIRNTYRQLNDTTIRTVHQWFPYPVTGRWRATEHEFLINTLVADGDDKPAQIELLFRALDRPDHVRNLLSLDLTGAWVNEAREVPWAIIDALQGRVDRYPAKRDGGATWAGILMDTNPPDTDSAWYRFFEQTDHREAVNLLKAFIPSITVENYCQIFKQPSGLSPQAENRSNQSPGYWQRLAIDKTEEWVRVYCKGEYGFVTEGRPVFPEYHDNVHCPGSADDRRAPRTDERLPVHRGWDFGLTPAVIFSQLRANGQWIVVDEMCADSMGIDRFSDRVLSHSSQFYPDSEFIDVGDPAGEARAETDERTCFSILQNKGIAIEAGLQSPQIRQECVRKPLRQMDDDGYPAFNLHPRCQRLRRALMGGYHYRKIQLAGTERWAERPEKNSYSHPADALQYTATRLFGPSMQWKDMTADNDLIELNSRLAQDRTRSRITGY